MSKDLTEQWRNGTLKDGAYYILVDKYEQNEPEIDVGICYNSNFEWWTVKEVLAPVPTYDQFSQMVKKVERLEQLLESETLAKQEGVEIVSKLEDRLKEANKTLMYVAAMMTCDPADMLETYPDFCADQWALDAVNKYLEKYGVEK